MEKNNGTAEKIEEKLYWFWQSFPLHYPLSRELACFS